MSFIWHEFPSEQSITCGSRNFLPATVGMLTSFCKAHRSNTGFNLAVKGREQKGHSKDEPHLWVVTQRRQVQRLLSLFAHYPCKFHYGEALEQVTDPGCPMQLLPMMLMLLKESPGKTAGYNNYITTITWQARPLNSTVGRLRPKRCSVTSRNGNAKKCEK